MTKAPPPPPYKTGAGTTDTMDLTNRVHTKPDRKQNIDMKEKWKISAERQNLVRKLGLYWFGLGLYSSAIPLLFKYIPNRFKSSRIFGISKKLLHR